MYCRYCGTKLTLRFKENEGLVPYCENCGKFVFPFFPIAVSMTVVNRAEDKILLARHTGEEDFKLFAGYIKKGETAEKTNQVEGYYQLVTPDTYVSVMEANGMTAEE